MRGGEEEEGSDVWVRESRSGFEGWKKGSVCRMREKHLFDQLGVRELLQLYKFIMHLFYCQPDEEVIKIKLFSPYCFVLFFW